MVTKDRQGALGVPGDGEARFRHLAEGLPQLVWTCEPNGYCDYLSPQWEAYTGLPASEQYGDRWTDQIHPDDRAHVATVWQQALASPQPVRAEFRLRRLDGVYRWFDTRALPLRDEQGRLVKWFGSNTDIHEERELREALRHERDRLTKVAESVPGCICSFRIPPAGGPCFPYLSPSTKDVLGLDPADLVNDASPFTDRVHPDDSARAQGTIAESARTMSLWHEVYLYHHPAKGDRWIDTCSIPVADPDGGITWHGYVHDVTEQRQIEAEIRGAYQALRESEERFRTLIEQASDLITVILPDGRIEFQSPASLRVLGRDPEAMLGHPLDTWVHPDDAPSLRATLAKAVHEPGTLVTLSARFHHQDGSWRYLECVGRGMNETTGETRIVMNLRDTTAARALEDQLRHSQKMEAVGRLAGGVAHDFNNILTVIQGNLSLLETESGLTETTRESLSEIKKAAERAANLTRQMLAFSRRQPMERRYVDLNDLVTNMTRMLRRLLGEDIGMELNLSPRPAPVLADNGMLEQVLLNLAVNSRDAMPKGGRLLIETSLVSLAAGDAAASMGAKPGDFVLLRVADTGLGIPAEVLGHIFEPFFTTKEVGRGTGLGLATVHGIVQQHEGWIEVESEPHRGATFTVFLPRSTAAKSLPDPPSPRTHGQCTGTILLVEDEPSVRHLVRSLLLAKGYRVIEAGTGVEALSLWTRHGHEVDLLFTDLVMPEGVGGFELAARLQADRPDLRVIFTSGYSPDFAGRADTFREGYNFLSKPFDLSRLLEAVQSSLAQTPCGTQGP